MGRKPKEAIDAKNSGSHDDANANLPRCCVEIAATSCLSLGACGEGWYGRYGRARESQGALRRVWVRSEEASVKQRERAPAQRRACAVCTPSSRERSKWEQRPKSQQSGAEQRRGAQRQGRADCSTASHKGDDAPRHPRAPPRVARVCTPLSSSLSQLTTRRASGPRAAPRPTCDGRQQFEQAARTAFDLLSTPPFLNYFLGRGRHGFLFFFLLLCG